MSEEEIKEMIISEVKVIENVKFLNFLLSLILHRARNKKEWDGVENG